MISFKEVFVNGSWIPWNNVHDKMHDDLFWRITQEVIDKTHVFYIAYFLGTKPHRVSGPSQTLKWLDENNEWQIEDSWYVNGIYLFRFNNHDNIISTIFDAVTKSPHLYKLIEIISRRNNLLDKKQLELLACLNMLK